MATTETPYRVTTLAEAAVEAARGGFGITTQSDPETGIRGRVHIRRDLGIGSFGVNAFYQARNGAFVVGEHDELGPGANRHEELYVVLQGSCTFTVGGDQLDAPQGTAVFVPDPATKRSARATADETIVLVVGGRPGEAFAVSPGEALGDFFARYRERDYEGALAACREALEAHPGNALVLYNVACLEALLGRTEEAFGPLADSLAAWPAYKELAATDDDLVSLRDDERFQALVA